MSAIPKLGLVGLGLGLAELWLVGLYLGLVWLELMDQMIEDRRRKKRQGKNIMACPIK